MPRVEARGEQHQEEGQALQMVSALARERTEPARVPRTVGLGTEATGGHWRTPEDTRQDCF